MEQLFKSEQVGDRWECYPSGFWAHFGFGFSLFGVVLMLLLGGTFVWNIGVNFMGIGLGLFFIGVAVMLFWQASRYWRLRHTPLTVDGDGRVSYGQEELCSPGSVQSVQIVPDPQAESGDCKIIFELADSKRAELSGPFFGAISRREVARYLASELAKALNVTVVETA